MKRFTVLYASLIGILFFSAVFEAWSDARAVAKNTSNVSNVYDATGAMLEAIDPRGAESSEASVVLVYDSTGAMLEAIRPEQPEADPLLVYDATGAMLEAIRP